MFPENDKKSLLKKLLEDGQDPYLIRPAARTRRCDKSFALQV